VANVIAIVRYCDGEETQSQPGLELSVNRSGDLFCLSLSVLNWHDNVQHELADHAADHLDTVVREILDDVYANPF
jgi:hypothetical protein